MEGWGGAGERSFGGEHENSGREVPAGEKEMYPPRQLLVDVASLLLPCMHCAHCRGPAVKG